MDANFKRKWIRRVKLAGIGCLLGVMILWIGVLVAGGIASTTDHEPFPPISKVLKK